MMLKVCIRDVDGALGGLPSGMVRNVDCDDDVRPHLARETHRHGRNQATVHIFSPANFHWLKTPGTELDARTAVPASPRWNKMGWPLFRSVATMPSGTRMFSIWVLAVAVLTNFANASPSSANGWETSSR